MRKVTAKQIRLQLQQLGFVKDGPHYSDPNYLKCRDLKARIVTIYEPVYGGLREGDVVKYIEEPILVLQFSEKRTFDRWANSTNFQVDLSDRSLESVDLQAVLKQVRKIIRSKVFNFNQYFNCIELYAR